MTKQEIEAGMAELENGFMTPEIWQDTMLSVETECGDELLPDDFGDPCESDDFFSRIEPHLEGKNIHSVDRVSGWFCRLSASGHLDCTETAGPFGCLYSAAEYLIETYGD